MVQYLMDQDAEVVIPAVAAPKNGFSDIVEPVQVSLEQEKKVTEQIANLARIACESFGGGAEAEVGAPPTAGGDAWM